MTRRLTTLVQRLPVVRGRAAAWEVGLAVAAVAAGAPVVELLMFRHWGSSPVPGPHALDATVGGDGEGERWVWLGDSLSAGIGADDADDSFPRQTAAIVAARLGCSIELRCLAVPGAASADVLACQVPAAVDLLGVGTVAVVAVGCNDVLQLVRPAAFRATYTDIVRCLAATGAEVVAVGVPDLASMITVMAQPLRAIIGGAGRYIDAIVHQVCLAHGVEYVAIADPFERSMLSSDRWHPNGRGYRTWADPVAARLARSSITLGQPAARRRG